jgi:FAS-associated factor 2
MTVLSRHQGAAATTPSALRDHINNNLLPRVKPGLLHMKAKQQERELERQLREEQDRRFEESARRDREKAELIRMEELNRRRKEEQEQQARRDKEKRESSISDAKAKWRQLRRPTHIPSNHGQGNIRVGIRLPDGKRITSSFSPEDSILSLFCTIDTHLNPSIPSPPDSVSPEVDELMSSYQLSSDEWWGFKIFSSYPRREITYSSSTNIGAEGVEGSISVEFVSLSTKSSDGESDGYETEDE